MRAGGGLNDPVPVQTRRTYREGIQRLPKLFEAFEVPIIAAVNGPAISAGFDLACMCDIRSIGGRSGALPHDGGPC